VDLVRNFLLAIAVILIGVVIATAASWVAKPAWATRGRAIAIFVTAVIAAAALTVFVNDPASPSTPASPGTSPSAGLQQIATTPASTPTSTAPATTPPANDVPLATLTPSIGATYITTVVPRALASQSTYNNAVLIHCGSGNVGDQFPDVTYTLNGRYIQFHTGIFAYEPKPEDLSVQLSVSLDQQSPVATTVAIGKTGVVDLAVDGVIQLNLRVSCDTPNATVILTGAYVVHE
jgi:hypothetical protein